MCAPFLGAKKKGKKKEEIFKNIQTSGSINGAVIT